MERLGHDVRHFETWDKALYPQYADLNKALLDEIDAYRPDIVFTVQRDYEIWTETLAAIRDEMRLPSSHGPRGRLVQVPSGLEISVVADAISTTYDYRVPDYK